MDRACCPVVWTTAFLWSFWVQWLWKLMQSMCWLVKWKMKCNWRGKEKGENKPNEIHGQLILYQFSSQMSGEAYILEVLLPEMAEYNMWWLSLACSALRTAIITVLSLFVFSLFTGEEEKILFKILMGKYFMPKCKPKKSGILISPWPGWPVVGQNTAGIWLQKGHKALFWWLRKTQEWIHPPELEAWLPSALRSAVSGVSWRVHFEERQEEMLALINWKGGSNSNTRCLYRRVRSVFKGFAQTEILGWSPPACIMQGVCLGGLGPFLLPQNLYSGKNRWDNAATCLEFRACAWQLVAHSASCWEHRRPVPSNMGCVWAEDTKWAPVGSKRYIYILLLFQCILLFKLQDPVNTVKLQSWGEGGKEKREKNLILNWRD